MAVGSLSVPLAKADFVPAGKSLDQQHAVCISSVTSLGPSKSIHLAKNEALLTGSVICSCQNPLLSSFGGHWCQPIDELLIPILWGQRHRTSLAWLNITIEEFSHLSMWGSWESIYTEDTSCFWIEEEVNWPSQLMLKKPKQAHLTWNNKIVYKIVLIS